MGRRKHRGSSKHRGVVLVERPIPGGAGTRWLGRYVDPDTGKRREVAVPREHTTREQRAAWAADLAQKVDERRRKVAAGGPVKTGRALADVVEQYFTDHAGRLRASSVQVYRIAADELLAFASERRIKRADDLRGEHLEAFRTWALARPRQNAARGEKRGARRPSGKRRSVVTANQRLRSVRTILTALRRLGLVPLLTSDDIKDRLRSEREPASLPAPLRPHEIPALLRAAMRHDAATFKITRQENKAGGKPGSTPKHQPVAPLVMFVLLTGMRRDEARLLRWDRVDVHHAPSGAIHLEAGDTKTARARMVDLSVSTQLQRLLAALRLRSGDALYVFGAEPPSRDEMKIAALRLTRSYGAPSFTWQRLRETCATYLANAGGIFSGASAYREAKQLGHSVAVAERRYCDVVHVDATARTLEAAMCVEEEAAAIVRQATGERVADEVMRALA